MKIIYKLLFVLVVLVSCNKGFEGSKSLSSTADYGMAKMASEGADIVEDAEINSEEIQRKLIKKGDISFETDNLSETRQDIEQAVKKYKGYISEDNEYKSSNTVTSSVTVRIPSSKFDVFLSEISSKVDKFDSKNISVNDVTEQFLDVQARLKVKKELENRYSVLLKKAKSVKEILEVERELTNVRSDIESMEGRLKYLQNQVSFSTLHIRFYKVELTQSSSKSFWRKLANSFANGIDNIKWFFLGLVNIWPFILLGILLFIFIRKQIKKRKK